jgi:DHA1 family bicyclomycin/chloramphenicol resistance-like MFS transporter
MSPPVRRPSSPTLNFVLILGALTAFTPLSVDMYLPAFPELERDLVASAGAVQRTLAVYYFGLSFGQLAYGPLSDRFGRRPPLIGGIVLYVAASVAAALVSTVSGLTLARLFQALGGCSGMVIARAVVADRFDERTSAKVFSLLMLVMGLAPILAPLAGGQVLLVAGWRGIFWCLAGFGLICLCSVLFGLRETLPPERRASGGISAAFRAYIRLLANRRYLAFALTGSIAMSALFAYITGSPHVFIELYGVSPQDYGYLFGLNAIGIIGGAQINVRLLRRWSGQTILRVAVITHLLAGIAVVAVTATDAGGLVGLITPLFAMTASLGFIIGNTVAAAMAQVSANRGAASALLGTIQFGHAAIVATLVGALQGTSSMPMAVVIALSGVGAFIMSRLAR